MVKRKEKAENDAEENVEAPAAEMEETSDQAEAPLSPESKGIEPFKDPNEYRTAPRVLVDVKAVVQFRESEEDSWKEIVQITTISKNGAALHLKREVPVGRVISMALQMPAELRVYDFSKDVYPMLGVVQNCSPITTGGEQIFHVGVAFIGKKLPESYKADPKQSYRIIGRTSLGLWEVKEARRQFVNRKGARFCRRFEVALSIRDMVNRETRRFKVFTRDISAGGMSVWGPLDAKIGDRVKVTSREHDFYGMAIVRNRTESKASPEKTMIHFEFDGAEFPIAKIDLPHKDPVDLTENAYLEALASGDDGDDDADSVEVSY